MLRSSSFRAFVSALLILTIPLACKKESRPDRIARGEVSINIGAEPTSMDPGLLTDLQGARAMLQIMRGLTTMDANGNPKPELAESWTASPDGLVYTFKLRQANWSNGQPITADDFVYSWRRVLNPSFTSQYAYQLFYIKGARAYYSSPVLAGKNTPTTPPATPSNPSGTAPALVQGSPDVSTPSATVAVSSDAIKSSADPESIGVRALAPDVLEVTLENPTPFFPQLVAHHTYFPVCPTIVKTKPEWYQHPESYVCSGPFKLVEYQPGYRIVVEKNPQYWNAAKVKMNRIVFRMIELESTELIAYDNGEIDGTHLVPSQDMDRIKTRPDFRRKNEIATYFVNINCRRKPFDDVRVRRALAMAINRQALADNVLRQNQRPAFTLTPPELFHGNPPEATFKEDFDEARRLLAEAGHTKEHPFPPFGYLFNTMEGHKKIALTLQETWKRELGIEMRLENTDWKVQVQRRHDGDYDLTRAGWHADFPDAINFLEMYDSESENNDPKFYDQKYDAMLAAIRAETDAERRLQLMRDAEKYLMEQMPIIPIYFYTQNYLCSPQLKGYDFNLLGLFDAVDFEWVSK